MWQADGPNEVGECDGAFQSQHRDVVNLAGARQVVKFVRVDRSDIHIDRLQRTIFDVVDRLTVGIRSSIPLAQSDFLQRPRRGQNFFDDTMCS